MVLFRLTAPVAEGIKCHFVLSVTCVVLKRCTFCFAGMAGAVHFLSDILVPETSRFPAFELGFLQKD